ncbi:pantetheine-phosphate adenylyltransferase [Nocardioidaceae bacterium]|nr:pantetheine-phosphate adenylyltransferase [Nocardioidaceae bacterium]
MSVTSPRDDLDGDSSARTVVCPGSFDPVHLGHLDVIERASRLFDRVVVAIGVNPDKPQGRRLLDDEGRLALLRETTAHLDRVEVAGFTGLLTDFCHDVGARAVVKGVRSGTDIEVETRMAHMNQHVAGIDTLLLPTAPHLSFVSSSLVKEVHGLGGDVSQLVPPAVLTVLRQRLG